MSGAERPAASVGHIHAARLDIYTHTLFQQGHHTIENAATTGQHTAPPLHPHTLSSVHVDDIYSSLTCVLHILPGVNGNAQLGQPQRRDSSPRHLLILKRTYVTSCTHLPLTSARLHPQRPRSSPRLRSSCALHACGNTPPCSQITGQRCCSIISACTT